MAAYAALVRRYQDMAVGCAYSLLGDFHLAEDAAQDAFVQAHRDLAALREPRAFASWLRRIVFKQCDRITRRKRVRTAPLDAAASVPSPAPRPDQAAERSEMGARVLEAVRSLPDRQRMVTTLFYIDGYSQKEIAEFLEVPTTTVKNRLHASRKRLKERMLDMVEEQLKQNAPDERFSQRVIEELLGRPRPLEIEGHPVQQLWDAIRAALPEYEVVGGPEIEDGKVLEDVQEDMDRAYSQAYRLGERQYLRTQMTVTTLKALRGRAAPVRLLAAGRVFRPCPDGEDATHLRAFHQVDGICVAEGADTAELKATLQRLLEAALGPCELQWRDHDFGFVASGLEVDVRQGGDWLEIAGSGLLTPGTLREAGYDPDAVGGYAFGMGLERLAMLRHDLDDVRALWRPPYV
jgi:RNA polymerase sigma factor (sigma-70 family)